MTDTNTAAEKTHFVLIRENGRADGAWLLTDTEALDFMKKSARKYTDKGEKNVRIVKITTAQAEALAAKFAAIAADLKPLDTELEAARKLIDHSWRSVDVFERVKRRINARRDEIMKRYDSVRL